MEYNRVNSNQVVRNDGFDNIVIVVLYETNDLRFASITVISSYILTVIDRNKTDYFQKDTSNGTIIMV